MQETISRKSTQQAQVSSKSATRDELDVVSVAIVGTMGLISAFIGIGALVCFVSALVNAGPMELIKGFISAITGI